MSTSGRRQQLSGLDDHHGDCRQEAERYRGHGLLHLPACISKPSDEQRARLLGRALQIRQGHLSVALCGPADGSCHSNRCHPQAQADPRPQVVGGRPISAEQEREPEQGNEEDGPRGPVRALPEEAADSFVAPWIR